MWLAGVTKMESVFIEVDLFVCGLVLSVMSEVLELHSMGFSLVFIKASRKFVEVLA